MDSKLILELVLNVVIAILVLSLFAIFALLVSEFSRW